MSPASTDRRGKAGTRDADTMLGELLAALKEQGLDKTTDIFVTADHGFLTISHASATSPSASGWTHAPKLSNGFLAVDLASACSCGCSILAQFRQRGLWRRRQAGRRLGPAGRSQNPDAVVVPNGGADLIYLPKKNAKQLAGDIVKFLTTQDYVSGIFVNDRLGKFPGALADERREPDRQRPKRRCRPSMSASAASPANARTSCNARWASMIPRWRTGQGSHGSLSRAETRNFMAAIGPDFKAGYADPAPISNADIAPTLAQIAGITLPRQGQAEGPGDHRGAGGRRRR